ncbi:hypothetical protein ACU21_01510 [Actinobaculum suis]|uniref:hypothetical protein n=1 Tax=Actinobaculum suis TaxID=1657 RepID=UPI0008087DA0|nr:hypothetical protein [Actinobaculum suis]OCA93151.1 hypothetical protein ACU21_01510 [Actinobaculum suis]
MKTKFDAIKLMLTVWPWKWELSNTDLDIHLYPKVIARGEFDPEIDLDDEFFDFNAVTELVAKESGLKIVNYGYPAYPDAFGEFIAWDVEGEGIEIEKKPALLTWDNLPCKFDRREMEYVTVSECVDDAMRRSSAVTPTLYTTGLVPDLDRREWSRIAYIAYVGDGTLTGGLISAVNECLQAGEYPHQVIKNIFCEAWEYAHAEFVETRVAVNEGRRMLPQVAEAMKTLMGDEAPWELNAYIDPRVPLDEELTTRFWEIFEAWRENLTVTEDSSPEEIGRALLAHERLVIKLPTPRQEALYREI